MLILHLTEQSAWRAAQADGAATPDSLDTLGFVHCCRVEQVLDVGRAFFSDARSPVALCVNTAALPEDTPVRFEVASGDDPLSGAVFPHVYGPLPVASVTRVVELDGTWQSLPPSLNALDSTHPPLDDEVVAYQTTPTWGAASVPPSLLARHDTKAGVFGRIEVLTGVVTVRHLVDPPWDEQVAAGEHTWVLPREPHLVELDDDARFRVAFHRVRRDG